MDGGLNEESYKTLFITEPNSSNKTFTSITGTWGTSLNNIAVVKGGHLNEV